MIKFKFTERDTEYHKTWLSFYPQIDRVTAFKIVYNSYWYFEPRPLVQTNVTSLLAIILPFFSLWFLPLSLIFLFVGWGPLFLRLPWDTGKNNEAENPEYGLHTYSSNGKYTNELWLMWGWKRKHISLPWALNWYRTSLLLRNGNWATKRRGGFKHFYGDDLPYQETFPYKYTLKSGEVQEVSATIKVEEREWRRNWLMFLPLFNLEKKTIEVKFDDEIGEETGSWKGGVTGCSYEMLPFETPKETLKRMEKERKF